MKKTIFFIIIFLLTGTIIWYFFIKMNKNKALDIIVAAKANRTVGEFSSFDEGFLMAWARAIKKGMSEFSYQNKNYSTDTAKTV